MISNEKYSKLPKYAQMEIDILRGKVEALERQLPTSWTQDMDTGVAIQRFSLGEDIPLPEGTRVRFNVGKKASIVCSIRDKRLYIIGSHHGPLVVYPQVTNVIELGIEERKY